MLIIHSKLMFLLCTFHLQIDGPLPLPVYTRHVNPDLSSDTFPDKEAWQAVWVWLPEWVTCESPECLFRASRDGYKLVNQDMCCCCYLHVYYCLEDIVYSLMMFIVVWRSLIMFIVVYSLRTLFRKCEEITSILLVVRTSEKEVCVCVKMMS